MKLVLLWLFQQGISISSSPLLRHIIKVPKMAGWCSVFMHSASLLLHSLIISHIFSGIPFLLITTKHASNFLQKQKRKLNKTQSSKDLFQLYILHKTIFFNKKFVTKISVCDCSHWQFWVFSLWIVQFNSYLSWSGVWCGLSFGLTKMLENVNHSCLLLSKDGSVLLSSSLSLPFALLFPSFSSKTSGWWFTC